MSRPGPALRCVVATVRTLTCRDGDAGSTAPRRRGVGLRRRRPRPRGGARAALVKTETVDSTTGQRVRLCRLSELDLHLNTLDGRPARLPINRKEGNTRGFAQTQLPDREMPAASASCSATTGLVSCGPFRRDGRRAQGEDTPQLPIFGCRPAEPDPQRRPISVGRMRLPFLPKRSARSARVEITGLAQLSRSRSLARSSVAGVLACLDKRSASATNLPRARCGNGGGRRASCRCLGLRRGRGRSVAMAWILAC
jgi:hypothetical protein